MCYLMLKETLNATQGRQKTCNADYQPEMAEMIRRSIVFNIIKPPPAQ